MGEVAELHLGLLSPDGQEGYRATSTSEPVFVGMMRSFDGPLSGNLGSTDTCQPHESRLFQPRWDRGSHHSRSSPAIVGRSLPGRGGRFDTDGEVIPVAGTILDFTHPRRLGDHIEELPETLVTIIVLSSAVSPVRSRLRNSLRSCQRSEDDGANDPTCGSALHRQSS